MGLGWGTRDLPDTHSETGELKGTLTEHNHWVFTLAFSPDGNHLASGSPDGTVKLWDPKPGELRKTLTDDHGGILRMAFSPDGRFLATAASTTDRNETVIDGEVALRDAQSEVLIWKLKHATHPTASLND